MFHEHEDLYSNVLCPILHSSMYHQISASTLVLLFLFGVKLNIIHLKFMLIIATYNTASVGKAMEQS